MILIEKENGLFDLKTIYTLLRAAKDGTYSIIVKRVRKKRSLDQNAWLWGCIYPLLLDGLIDAGWEFTDVEQVHEFFKAQMTLCCAINKQTGEIVEFPSSTSLMNTLEFSTYIDKLREYANEYLGIDIPEPDIDCKQKKIIKL